MKNLFIAAVFFFCAAFSAYAFDGNDVNQKLGDFSSTLNAIVANAATEQNVYSSAWIGKVFPSAPPHFAAGVEAGVTKFDMSPLKDVANIFSVTGLPSLLVFPTITANARVGGLFLPFDIGVSAMYLDLSKLDSIADGLGFQFFDIGGDIRWAILKGTGPLPQISLGAGYYYTSGRVSYEKEGLVSKVDYACHTAFLQAQISKTFLFITPYLGIRGIVYKSESTWNWFVTPAQIVQSIWYNDTACYGTGSATADWFGNVLPQIYGGVGLNLAFFALNFSAAYEFKNNIWGGNLSIRFQM